MDINELIISTYCSKPSSWVTRHEDGVKIEYKGITVQCHTERSQHANRAKCMEVLERYFGKEPQGELF